MRIDIDYEAWINLLAYLTIVNIYLKANNQIQKFLILPLYSYSLIRTLNLLTICSKRCAVYQYYIIEYYITKSFYQFIFSI